MCACRFIFCLTFRVRHTEPETLKAERGSAEVLSVAAGWALWFSFLGHSDSAIPEFFLKVIAVRRLRLREQLSIEPIKRAKPYRQNNPKADKVSER